MPEELKQISEDNSLNSFGSKNKLKEFLGMLVYPQYNAINSYV